MTFTVYILFSKDFLRHYTGFTSNLEQRLVSHNELCKDWTSKYRPWEVIYAKEFKTKKEAMEYEKWLKSGTGRQFIKTIQHTTLSIEFNRQQKVDARFKSASQ